ncbi:MAG: D-aminoacyl-tRNA deacylase [Wenzhouxiangellaceae bacterium]
MILLLQRVSSASVSVDDNCIAAIGAGILVLCGFERGDDADMLPRMCERLLNYRLFSDTDGKMNLSVKACAGELLLVPQFTLAADTGKGNRPGFSTAAAPRLGRALFVQFVEQVQARHAATQCGRFGADMQVALVNDGPVTFWLQQSPQSPDC